MAFRDIGAEWGVKRFISRRHTGRKCCARIERRAERRVRVNARREIRAQMEG